MERELDFCIPLTFVFSFKITLTLRKHKSSTGKWCQIINRVIRTFILFFLGALQKLPALCLKFSLLYQLLADASHDVCI